MSTAAVDDTGERFDPFNPRGVSPRVILVDGERLAELMIDHNVGVSDRQTYAVQRVDSDYFDEEEL